MDNTTILTIALVILIVVLTVLLIRRTLHEKRQLEAIRRMNLAEFGTFLRSNSVGGNIAEVAGKVSDLLRNAFGCDRILFLRKKRRLLEVNFYYGMVELDRRSFRLPAERPLMKKLADDFLPRPIAQLHGILPGDYLDRLRENGFGLFFPIFWRENLYGIYFVRSTIETRSAAFNLMVASLAQSLSAAYHIKWHESRYENAQSQLERARARAEKVVAPGRYRSHLLQLVNHRNSETLMPKLVEYLRRDLGLNRVAYLYQPRDAETPRLVHDGLDRAISIPDQKVFDDLLKAVSNGDTFSLTQVADQSPSLKRWTRSLTETGLDRITALPPTTGRAGLLAWGGGQESLGRKNDLETLKVNVRDIIQNVESFEQIEQMSQTDGLTGLSNQRYFLRRLDEEVQRAQRYSRTLALIFFDLDELKAVNDTHGHQAGDAILEQMGQILNRNIRAIDIIARYGGDEFCVIMPEADQTVCGKFMERLKAEVGRHQFAIGGLPAPLTCTVSLGGSIFPDHADNPRQLIFTADMALLKAKEMGRNKAVLYDVTMTAKA